MADPLKDIFGDPLADVFGAAPDNSLNENPLKPKKPIGALAAAVEGKSQSEAASAAANDQDILEAASNSDFKRQSEVTRPRSEGLGEYAADKLKSFDSGIVSTVGMGLRGLGREGQRMEGVLGTTLFGGDQEQANGFLSHWFAPGSALNSLIPGAGILLNPGATSGLTRSGEKVQGVSDAINVSPEKQQEVGNIVANATGQVAGLIAMSAVAPEAVNPAILGQSFDQIDQSLKEYGVKDNSVAGLAATSTGGPVMAILERTGLDQILEGVPLAIKNRVIRAAADLGITAGWEATEEVLQQVVQNFATKLGVDPNTPVRDWPKGLGEGIEANAEGGFGAGLLARLVMGGLGAHYKPRAGDTKTLFGETPGTNEDVLNALSPDQTGVAADSGPTPAAAPTTPSGVPEKEALPTFDALKQQFGPELDAVSPAREQPLPAPELGHGFTPHITPEDEASPIPTGIIAAGKDLLGSALNGKAAHDILKAHILGVESGGKVNAQNPLSSASGLYQFTDSTWLGLGGDLSKKNDPVEQGRMMDKLLSQNEAALRKDGHQATAGNLYLAHFLGAGGANAALDNPNAPVDAKVQKANPFTQGWTNGQLAAWANRKMGGKPGEWTNNPNLAADRAWAEKDAGADREALTVEGTMAQALGPEASDEDFKPGNKIMVTQNGETVPGVVNETYGEGPAKGVKIALDNGTTFDEEIARARQYGAQLTLPHNVGDQVETNNAAGVPNVAVPEEAQPKLADHLADAFGPQSYAGEKIDNEFTAFAPHTGTLGIPRAEMPQIKQEDRGAAVNFFEARGITHEEETVPASSLKPTQAEFAPAKVQKFLDQDAGDRAVLASSDGYVLDGHHQWVAALDKGSDVRVIRLNAPIRDLIEAAHAFPSSRTSEGATGAGPRVFVNLVGRDGKTDAERGYALPAADAIKEAAGVRYRDSSKLREAFIAGARGEAPGKLSKPLHDAFNEGDRWLVEQTKAAKAGDRPEFTRERAREVAIEAARRGHADTSGNIGDVNYSFGQRANLQKGPMMTPGKVNVEHRGTVHSFSEQEIREAAAKSASTAPEHAAVGEGVDDRELGEIVTEFNDAQQSMIQGEEEITHVFDAPKKGEIVRLNEKSRVYHKEHGWMSPKEAAALIDQWEAHAVQQGTDPKTRSANADKIVLSLFDLTGSWSEPWEQAGYQVFRFDIQDDAEVGDVNNFSSDFFGDWFGDFEGKDIYAILAACPCTDFASSGARHFAAKDADGRTVASVKLVHQTLATIEHFKPAVWALENPVGRIEKLGGLPPWRLSFDPNDLGEPYTKKTLLWGRFNADLPGAPVEPKEGSKMWKLYGGKSLKTKNARSATPRGFSYSFFMANNALDHQAMAIANKYDRLDRGLIEKAVAAGVTEEQIDHAVEDHYYQELDDNAANDAIRELIKNPEPTGDQPSEAPISTAAAESIREQAAPFQHDLVGFALASGYRWLNPGTKSAARIVEKALTEGYKSILDLKDIVRGGFVADAPAQADHIAAGVRGGFNLSEDKGWKAVVGGYFDYKLIVEFKGGIKGEIQIIPQPIYEAKAGGLEKVYNEARKIPGFDSPNPPPEAAKLIEQMITGYAKAVSGTSWASLFKESMDAYAARNDFAKSVWDKLEPSFETSPGAGTQESPSNTNANPLPPETPLATGRPSISTNQSAESSIDSNVGNAPQVGNVASPEYGAKNTIVTRGQADIARAIIRNKLKNQLNSGFDPELLSAGMQIAAFHLEAGARKFADFTKAVAEDIGMQTAKLKPYLAAWYNGARDMLEGHGIDVSDMDSPETVRAGIASLPESVDVSGDNGGTNGGIATNRGIEGADRAGNAGERAGNAPGAEGERGVGAGPDGEGSPGERQLSDSNGPSDGERPAGEPQTVGQRSGERDNAGPERGSPRSAQPSRRVRDTARGTDFRAGRGALERTGSWHDAANRNLDTIELVNKLDAEGRPATPDEQALLSKWVGWGASEIRNKLFRSVDRRTMTISKDLYAGEWSQTVDRARELLTGKDLETALQSVQYAHYTSEGVVRSMWDAFERMGFRGGRILEPGMGIGHFFTAAPDSVADHSTYTGVELDAFSAKVAKYLLPNENVIQGDYTKQAFPDGFFDAAIGNPPFANTKILDDPAYKKMRLSLHNYFFVKTLDKVRPGGLLAFITSRYTMDAIDPKQRQFMADRADLVGAIRLPQTAFKQNAGTDVVTDVLFFQRRMPGADSGGEQWLNIKPVTVDGQKVNISEYFAAHPEMVLGRHKLHRGMYRENDLTVEPYASKGSIEKQFADATKALPENIYTAQVQKSVDSIKAKTFERDFAPASSKEGGLYVNKDGELLVVDHGSGISVEAVRENLKAADQAWLKGYTKLRDALKEAQRAQLDDAADWETKLDALRKEYAKFTKANGRIKEFTTYERTTTDDEGAKNTLVYRRFKWDKLLFDVEAPMVESLERITDAGEIQDGPFLKGRTLNKPSRPKIESVHDALAVTLDEIGKLDLPYVAKLAGISEDAAVEQLGDRVFQSPAGEWQTDDEYLSGDVLKKLEEAQAAAVTAPEFQRNVEALIKVQPQPLSYDRIAVKLGAPWIRPETVQQFADEVLGEGGVPITYETTTAHWNVEGSKARYRRSVTADFGTPERSALELLDAVLNNRSIKVTQKIDGKEVVLPDQTTAANEAAKKIAERFKTWLWEDSARTAEYVDAYNRGFNNIAPRRFNGDHLTLPGLSANFKPHPHVKRAVWRIIQTGNTYLAHAVGAGKTAEQIIGAQEQKRLGLIKKPMHVVPNHMLKQFSQEFLELYPAANIMVADEQAFHTGNRRRFLAQAALNDPDAIIITHSAFGKVDTSPEMKQKIIREMVFELQDAMDEAKESDAPRHLVSRIEKQIEQLKRRFEGRTGTGKDKLLTFDELGVDFLLVDEAHMFRKLDFATNRQAKGIDATGSARALDLFIKSQWLEQRQPGRSMVMASGTPVTNTMAELYTVMRFMDLKGLEKDRIAAFDAWANMFGEVAAGYERNAAGGYEIVERFSKFVNVPELMKRVRNFMDVLSSAQLGDLVTRPKIIGGGPQNVITPISDELEGYMKGELDTRLKKSREWKPSKDEPANPDPVINIITDARLSSIDMRYIHPGTDADPESKLNQMIERIAAKHGEYAALTYTNKDGTRQPRKGAAQIIFSPVGFGEQVAKNRGFDVRGWIDSELIKKGVKKSEIGWMSDANTHAKKEQLQKDVRSGKVRMIFGSPMNMGTGLNVQDRLKVLHYLSPPWYPSDVTQPHGRIERQGNQNPDAEILWYATKGTYDSTGWGMVARKQKFIDDAMSGDDSVRTLEDISEVNQFEMAAALAAGDDRVIRIAELGGNVERLTRLKGAHADTQRTLRGQISTIQEFELPRLEKHQSELQAAQSAKGGYQPFSLTVDGQSFEKHGEAGAALKASIEQAINASTAIERTEVGKLYGKFPVSVDATRHGDFQLSVDVGGVPFNAGRPFEKTEEIDDVGVIRSLESSIASITSSLQQTGKDIAQAQQQLDAAKRKYGAPFPEEAQLNDAIAERNQLQSEMAAETKAKDEAAKASALPAQVRSGEFTLTPENGEAFRAEMKRQLREFLPNDSIAVRVVDKLPVGEGMTANGQYHPWLRMISLAEDTAQPEWTLAHEGLHAMRSLGLFTESEWNRLVKFAWTDNQAEQAQIRERWGSLGLTEEQLQEEAVAELFGEYWDTHKAATTPLQKLFIRSVIRTLRFLAAIRRAVRFVLGKPDDGLGSVMDLLEQMRKGYVGARPEGFGNTHSAYPVEAYAEAPLSVATTPTPASPAFDGETERRWQEANGVQVDGAGILTKAKTAFDHFIEGWSRHYEHLPNSSRFADAKEQLRKVEAAPEAAYEKVVRHLTNLVGSMSREEYDLFKRKTVLDDLSWEADREHELPFGFTPKTLLEARRNVDAQFNLSPKLVKALRTRKAFNAQLAEQMVDAGILTREQIRNPAYYRHMVLDYARAQIEAAQNGGTIIVNGKPVRVRSPYWAKRKGSSLDINSNLLEAEADWMLKAFADIQTAQTLNWIKDSDHNIREQLRTRAKDANKEAYAAELKSNPSAAKEDARFRSMVGRGYSIVKAVLEDDSLIIPDHLQAAADSIIANDKSEAPFALLSWLMDEKKPGAQGAALILTATGGKKKLMRKLLGDAYAEPEDIKGLVKRYKPEGFTDWQPLEGQHLFTGKTVSEHVLDMFVSKLGEEEYPGVDKLELERALGTIRPQLVVGGARYTMVIPDELAATLNDFGDKASHNMFLNAVAGIQAKWKQFTLVNPRRWFRYNFNNMTGDLDAIIAGKPSSLLKLPQAAKELWSISRGGPTNATYKEALDRGVFQAGITRQEVPDINQFKGLRHLSRSKAGLRPDKLAVQLVSNLWSALKGSTQFRESLFRYAAYLKYKEEIDAGKDQKAVGYGGSNPALVDAVQDPADKAALLSRELIGDYGNVSLFGQRMRRYIMPFWSWPEINTKRYFRLTANAFQVSYARGIATGGLLGAGVAARSAATMTIRMALVFALINLWNRLLHGDDEDKLDDQQKHQLHLILGHDSQGQVYTLRMQGALSDVLDELGFSDTVDAFKNWEDSKGTFGEVLLATPKAIVNRVGPGNWNPLYMEPIQLALRQKLWPDLFHPRTIHDRARDVAQTFSVENEYDALAHRPTQGYGRSWLKSFAYQRDPGEMAYNNTRDLIGNYMREKEGLEMGRSDISPRSEALRDYKMALRYGDVDAAKKALADYAKYDGTMRGLKESIKGAAPLHPLPKRDRKAFMASLTDEQFNQLVEAQRWYEETYLKPH